jgi:hypothetical protein
LLGRQMRVGRLFGRVDRVRVVDAILGAGGRLGRIQTCLVTSVRQCHSDDGSFHDVIANLDQVLALGLGHQRLQLGRGEGVYQTRLGHDEQQDLGACQDRQLIGLVHKLRVSQDRLVNWRGLGRHAPDR